MRRGYSSDTETIAAGHHAGSRVLRLCHWDGCLRNPHQLLDSIPHGTGSSGSQDFVLCE